MWMSLQRYLESSQTKQPEKLRKLPHSNMPRHAASIAHECVRCGLPGARLVMVVDLNVVEPKVINQQSNRMNTSIHHPSIHPSIHPSVHPSDPPSRSRSTLNFLLYHRQLRFSLTTSTQDFRCSNPRMTGGFFWFLKSNTIGWYPFNLNA